jgi:hypothetical protein
VLHQAAERGLRRNMPLTKLLIRKTVQLALQYVPVQIKECLQHLSFPAGAYQLIRRKRRNRAGRGHARMVSPAPVTVPCAGFPAHPRRRCRELS